MYENCMNYKQMIQQMGIKQKYIAEKLGISEAYLSMFLSGKRTLPTEKKSLMNKILQSKGE